MTTNPEEVSRQTQTQPAPEERNEGGHRMLTEVSRRTEVQDDPRNHVEHRHNYSEDVVKSRHHDERWSLSDSYTERDFEPRNGGDNVYSRDERNLSLYQNGHAGPVSRHSGLFKDDTVRHSRTVSQSDGEKGSGILYTVKQWGYSLITKPDRGDVIDHLESEIVRIRASRKRRVREKDSIIEELWQKMSRLEDENQHLLTDVRSLELEAGTYKTQFENTRTELECCKSQLGSCEAECQRRRLEFSDALRRNGSLETELRQKATLLETRTTELRTAETYLSKYDEIPGDEVVSLISNLNQLALGVAEKCCESFSYEKRTTPREQCRSNEENEMLDRLSSVIGPPLVGFLLSKDHNEDPTIVQLSIQAVLMRKLYSVINRWPIPLDLAQDFGNNFMTFYNSIHGQEMQTVAARWRALGSKHLRLQFPITSDNLVLESMPYLGTVLRAAGADFASSQMSDGQLKEDLTRLWELASSLAEKMKESVLSTDYKLIFIQPGSGFNEDFAQSQGSVEGRSQVLCTTELGLVRVTNAQKAEGALSELETRVMSKSTVIFKHEIEEMFA
ncbi:hypothetical protein M0805_004506 [Coniferiporia weirii]|nr:hypothetical protein M0805_004506 [Coniferiporia weirii]